MDNIIVNSLPAECISLIISLNSPPDACRLSAVSPAFKSAADSDTVWEKFLPSDYQQIIASSSASSSCSSSSVLLNSLSKKNLYFRLCNNPILIDDGNMCFGLEKESGKKCYMIGARALSIPCKDAPTFCLWKSIPESRFAEVVELKVMFWIDVKGRIETKILSPNTTYAAYLVYKLAEVTFGFKNGTVQLSVYFEGTDEPEKNYAALLDPAANKNSRQFLDGAGGWMEIEMGEFFVNGDDGRVVCSLFDMGGLINYKRGLVIQGIMVRPKH
ncbi:putative F-box family protein [Melia azedarach]|uniref:F-box family protein n=1 Tax=Melia azedarach TaxID=155640 RepID=A0ACC1YGM6_MELAZ|nr:putative F-box family protein [Melia azedarach]